MTRARDKASAVVANFASTGIDDNADANAITIDSSENVLVDKTSSNYQTVGHELRDGGRAFHTADGGKTLSLNRLSSDGGILDFYKDNTEVGSIGSKGGDLTLGTGAIGVRFEDSNNAIVPFDTGTLGSSDNDIDLGKSSVRWNDLYLGGNLYLGGTGSANAISDVEEGTFTPTITTASSYSQQLGAYTKIGNLVNVQVTMYFVQSGTTMGAIQGLPFALADGNYISIFLKEWYSFGTAWMTFVQSGGTGTATLRDVAGNSGTASNGSTYGWAFSFTYQTT